MTRNFIGTIFQTLGNNRVKFSTKPGGDVHAGELVEVTHGLTSKNYLGRVISIERRNYLIDLDSSVQLSSLYDAEKVRHASDVGVSGNFRDYIVGEVQIIGRREDNNKRYFEHPSSPFCIGDKIYSAEKDFLQEQLKVSDDFITIGTYKNNSEVPINLDYNELVSKHFCVLAMTGSGKSWTIAVLIEELSKTGLPIIIFDPHGEYSSLKKQKINTSDNVSNKVRVFVAATEAVKNQMDKMFENKYHISRKSERICINLLDLETYQIVSLLQELYSLSEAQTRILDACWADLGDDPDLVDTTDIKKILEKISEYGDEVTTRTAINTLKTKIKLLYKNAPFIRKNIEEEVIDIHKIVRKGQISVIDLSGIQLLYQQALIAVLCNQILELRVMNAIPPVLCIFEEAHRFIPAGNVRTASKPTIKRIAQEGRKFLLGLGIVSQRPSRVDDDVISQCNTQIIMRLSNPNDQRYVQNVSEFVDEEDLIQIKSLIPGECYIFGSAVTISLPVRVKSERETEHGGYTPPIKQALKDFQGE